MWSDTYVILRFKALWLGGIWFPLSDSMLITVNVAIEVNKRYLGVFGIYPGFYLMESVTYNQVCFFQRMFSKSAALIKPPPHTTYVHPFSQKSGNFSNKKQTHHLKRNPIIMFVILFFLVYMCGIRFKLYQVIWFMLCLYWLIFLLAHITSNINS